MRSPAVNRRALIFLAGVVWSAVGIVLIGMAVVWFWAARQQMIIPLLLGASVGYAIYRWGFSPLARKNLVRIFEQAPGKEKVCLFAFQNWRSYIIVAVMMAMGYTLRHSPLPKIYLAPVYLAIGSGLLGGSGIYFSGYLRASRTPISKA